MDARQVLIRMSERPIADSKYKHEACVHEDGRDEALFV